LGGTHKSRLKRKSLVALEAGLDSHPEYPVQAGALGLRVLEQMNALSDSGREDFAAVARLPVPSWNIGRDPKEFRHYGPMAQDFFEPLEKINSVR